MINSYNTYIEVPPFDLPVILAFNAGLWLLIAAALSIIW